jgi:hypothetical protein
VGRISSSCARGAERKNDEEAVHKLNIYAFGANFTYDTGYFLSDPTCDLMADESNPILSYLKEIGGVFKLGSGVLGKSAIVIGILMVAIIAAVWRLHSDPAIVGTIIIGGGLFYLWFRRVLEFASKHPDLALLEGAEWTGWKRFEAEAKQGLGTEKEQIGQADLATLQSTTNPQSADLVKKEAQ